MDDSDLIKSVEDMFPKFIKPEKCGKHYKFDELQTHRKHGHVAIYRLNEECSHSPHYLVLTWPQAHQFKLKTKEI